MQRSPGGRVRRALAPLAMSLLTLTSASGADVARPAFRHRLPSDEAVRLEPAFASAAQRLTEPGCGRLLEDFADARGRSLESRIDELGLDRASYPSLVVFVDGRNAQACQRGNVLAVTNPGGRVVAVCPAFFRTLREDRRLAEDILIHEMLHTLGLGENPPSSLEINRRVFERCGR
jgi:hypothetical protein